MFDAALGCQPSKRSLPIGPSIRSSPPVDVGPEKPASEPDANCAAHSLSAIVADKPILKARPLFAMVVSTKGNPVPRLVGAAKSQRDQMVDLEFGRRKCPATASAAMAILLEQACTK
jgi:hypothetical protein